jgi:hypothetical protein
MSAALFRHPALAILAVYVLARAVTTGFLLLASAASPPGSRFGRGATLAEYIVAWDAQWYWLIAVEGYPADLPRGDDGAVAQNGWAFMPVFPFLARAVGVPLGAWGAGAVLIALAAGYACCLLLWSLLRERIGRIAALWAVVFFAAGPLSALFQVAYAETLFLMLVLWGIRCLQRRSYGWLYPTVLLMAYTRPGVLAFALLLGLFGIWRILSRHREPLGRIEILHILALGAVTTAAGFSWTLIAGWVTGDQSAYLETELAWRRLWVGDEGGFVPFEGWIQAADFWFRTWGLPPWLGFVALALGVAAVALLLAREPHVKRLGVEVRLWAVSYLVYLLAVFFPQSSVFRLLFPLSPLWGALAAPRSTLWRISILGACLVGQWWWIWNMYGIGSSFWQIP